MSSVPRGEERHGEFVQKAREPIELGLQLIDVFLELARGDHGVGNEGL